MSDSLAASPRLSQTVETFLDWSATSLGNCYAEEFRNDMRFWTERFNIASPLEQLFYIAWDYRKNKVHEHLNPNSFPCHYYYLQPQFDVQCEKGIHRVGFAVFASAQKNHESQMIGIDCISWDCQSLPTAELEVQANRVIDLTKAGWNVFQFSASDLSDPFKCVDKVFDELADRLSTELHEYLLISQEQRECTN